MHPYYLLKPRNKPLSFISGVPYNWFFHDLTFPLMSALADKLWYTTKLYVLEQEHLLFMAATLEQEQ